VLTLAEDEPPPVEVTCRDRRSPFVFACDHAGRRLPRSLGTLGLSGPALQSHIAWDIGAAGVAGGLGAALDAFVVLQNYSRLVIDCNRPLDASDSIAVRSAGTVIPGNERMAPNDAKARATEIFHPYHDQIRRELDSRKALGLAAIYVAIHSFTPAFMGVSRPWHVGVLFNRDPRLAKPLLRLLEQEGDLCVGCNEPYAVSDDTDFSIVQHGERRGIPHVELEIRQDLIGDEAGQTQWATRLARLLPLAANAL
jgi:predicted N-formylglutamate amidohydrolase